MFFQGALELRKSAVDEDEQRKLLAFAATTSSQSINWKLVDDATGLLDDGLVDDVTIETIDLNDFEMLIYSEDRERDGGIPQLAHDFFVVIGAADAVLISTLDTSATTVTISVKKLGFIEVAANLTVSSGTIEIDDDHRVASVDIAADAASYASNNPKRNEHVVGSDFLDAADHPAIRFEVSSVASGATGYTAEGTATIKGKSAQIAVATSDVIIDGGTGSFTATATVDRNAIGVDKMPSFIIGRNLQLTVSAAAAKTA